MKLKTNTMNSIRLLVALAIMATGGCTSNRLMVADSPETMADKTEPGRLAWERETPPGPVPSTHSDSNGEQHEAGKTAPALDAASTAHAGNTGSAGGVKKAGSPARLSAVRAHARAPVSRNKPPARSKTPGNIVFNFDDADLYEVIRAMADLLNINYLADPNVRGKVTIHTAGGLTRDELFPVFFQILELNGYTAVREGDLYKIVSIKDAARMPIASRLGYREADLPAEDRFMIQIIPLNHISVQEMTKLLTPFISAEGSIVSHGDSNTLLVVDRSGNVQKVLKLVDVFDINMFGKVSHRFYSLSWLNTTDAAKLLGEILEAYGKPAGQETKIIPIERLNMLLVLSPNPATFEKITEFLTRVDVAGHDIEPRIYVYPVKNSEAGDLARLLNLVFTGKNTEKPAAGATVTEGETPAETPKKKPVETPFGTIVPKSDGKPGGPGGGDAKGSGTLKSDVNITPDEVRNALIIEAIPKDYRIIENILKRLDVLPRQVLIEVTIAEITLDNSRELGLEWEYLRGDGKNPTTNLLSTTAGAEGLQYVIGQTGRWKQILKTKETESKVNILSAPTVLASDNKEAKIDISTEIPVASTQYQYDTDNKGLLETNIQYRNTGVILTVTPHINEFGLVSMDISQEVSNQLENNVQVGNDSLPAFFKRSVNTSLTVKHGQTIVIGGLIKETVNRGYSGLPCLGGVPLARYLAGNTKDSKEKTELIILITPRVIANLSDVDAVTSEFKNKVGNAMKSEEQ